MKIITLFLWTAGAGALLASEGAGMPEAVPLARYQPMIEKSPFAPATAAATPAPKVEEPSFAKDFYVVGMAQIGNENFVTISSRDKQERFSMLVGETVNGITLSSVEWVSEVGKSKATLKKGTEFGVVTFDEAAMQAAPVPAVAAPAIAQIQQPGMNGNAIPNAGGRQGRRNMVLPGQGGHGQRWPDRRQWSRGDQSGRSDGQWRRRPRPIPTQPTQ